MTCSGCSHVNESGRRYCGQCGLDNRPACTRCGFGNSASDRFCGGCGNGMVKAAAVGAGAAAASAVSAARRVSALPPPPTTFAAAARANDPLPVAAVAAPKPAPVAAVVAPPPSVTVDIDGILSAAELQLLITPKPQAAAKAESELPKDHVTQDDLDSLFEANS
jgi:hypothetical protein